MMLQGVSTTLYALNHPIPDTIAAHYAELGLSELGFFRASLQGVSTTLHAATAPELEGKGGAYLSDCAVKEPSTDTAKSTEQVSRKA